MYIRVPFFQKLENMAEICRTIASATTPKKFATFSIKQTRYLLEKPKFYHPH